MWFATDDGLNRYDGYTIKNVKTDFGESDEFGSCYINSIMEDSKGRLWIGSDAGVHLYIYEEDSFKPLEARTKSGEAITAVVNNIIEDKSHNIWISTSGEGCFRYNLKTDSLDQYSFPLQPQDFINNVYEDNNGDIWIASRNTSAPLAVFEPDSNKFRIFDIKLNADDISNSVLSIFEDSCGLWLGTWSDGVRLLDRRTGKTRTFVSPRNGNGAMHVHFMEQDNNGNLLIGSDDGLTILNPKTADYKQLNNDVTDPSSLSDKFVYPIVKDREGGIWIGTYYGGVNYLSPNNNIFKSYTHSLLKNSVSGNIISCFCEDNNGQIWMGTEDGGLNRFDPETKHFDVFLPGSGNSISYHNIHALCSDGNLLWIGTYTGGLNTYNLKTGRFRNYSNSLQTNTIDGNSIYSIFRDRDGNIWVASLSGINLYNRKTDDFTRIRSYGYTTTDIKQGNDGDMWFATAGRGIFRFNKQTGEWRNYRHTNKHKSITSNHVNHLAVSKNGNIWIATINGLCLYEPQTNSFTNYPLNIPSINIKCIIEDGENLWLTTSCGLVLFNPSTGETQIFNRHDGLLSDDFMPRAAIKAENGQIYLGTRQGFNTFSPNSIQRNKYVPPVVITNLEIHNREIGIDSNGPLTQAIFSTPKLTLTNNDNVLSISYSALSYMAPEKNRYAYKLEGFDREWNFVGSQTKTNYTNLPAGHYEFKVLGCNNDGEWNNTGATIGIVIKPALFLSIGFKILYFVLFTLLVTYLLRHWINNSERKHIDHIRTIEQNKEIEIYNAKLNFFSTIANEIRTPVSMITEPAERMLEKKNMLQEDIAENVVIIERNSKQLLALINQLLDFRKVEAGTFAIKYNMYDLVEMIENVSEQFAHIFEQHNIKFMFNCKYPSLNVIIDIEAITKVISHLLSNAIKYTKNEIIADCCFNADLQTIDICISDNGCGIKKTEFKKIFQPFYQSADNNEQQGTGLGLSLVQSLTTALNGKVSVQSGEGKGSTFTVTLPARHKFSEDERRTYLADMARANSLNDDSDEKKEHLLIVDSNKETVAFLQQNLNKQYIISISENEQQATEIISKNHINLIIADLLTIKSNRAEFCKSARTKYRTPIILLTDQTDINTKAECLNQGFDVCIEKPFSVQFLRAQISNLLKRKRQHRKTNIH